MSGNYKKTIALLNLLQVVGWFTAIAGLYFGFRIFQSDGLMLAMVNFAPTVLAGMILMRMPGRRRSDRYRARQPCH